MRRLLPTLLVCALAALTVPAFAAADAGSNQIISECANESLSKTYTQKQYDDALKDLPADLKEYTDCADVIKSAQRAAAAAGKGDGKTTSGGSTPRAVTGGGGGSTGGTAPPTTSAGGSSATAVGSTAPAPSPGTAAPASAAPAAPAAAPAADPNAANAAAAADQAALQEAQRSGASPVDIAGTTLNPGDPAGVALSLDDLPTPMLVLLGLFALVALVGLAALIKGWVMDIGSSRDTADPR